MAAPSPISNTVTDAEAFIREGVTRSGGLARILGTTEEVATALLERAAIAATVGEGAAAVTDAGIVAGFIATVLDLPLILLALIVLLALLAIERGLSGLLGFLPWGWGGQWANGIHRVFSPLENLENAIVGAVGSAVTGLFTGIKHIVGWGMAQNQLHTAAVAQGSTTDSWNYLNKRTMALWAWDSRLQADVTALQRALSHPLAVPAPTSPPLPLEPPTVIQNTTVTTPVPQNVWDQLSHLASQNEARQDDIESLQSQLSRVEHEVATLQSEVVTLSRGVHSVRAISIGLQDMQQQMTELNNLFVAYTDQVDIQFQHQAHEIGTLAPLHLLLQLGAVGVQTLRQLQDTPCMCPKLPRIPRLHPELLAMYEFASYG